MVDNGDGRRMKSTQDSVTRHHQTTPSPTPNPTGTDLDQRVAGALHGLRQVDVKGVQVLEDKMLGVVGHVAGVVRDGEQLIARVGELRVLSEEPRVLVNNLPRRRLRVSGSGGGWGRGGVNGKVSGAHTQSTTPMAGTGTRNQVTKHARSPPPTNQPSKTSTLPPHPTTAIQSTDLAHEAALVEKREEARLPLAPLDHRDDRRVVKVVDLGPLDALALVPAMVNKGGGGREKQKGKGGG